MHLANALLSRPAAPGSLDSLGCSSGLLAQSQELHGRGISFYRKRSDGGALRQVVTPASDRGVLVGISMGTGHHRRIFHENHASSHDFDAGSVYLRDFAEDYHADLRGPFDFLLMEVSRGALARALDDKSRPGQGATQGLAPVAGGQDPVLVHLAHAVAPALARPQETSALFIDQIGAAIGTWLAERYLGRGPAPGRRVPRLSRAHEARAKALLLDHLDGNIAVTDVAEACQLSRSYFIRAFRETTGHTPHQWLLAQRVTMARQLLASSTLTLVDIAAACGFADQSHFTRVFTRTVGTPPGHWRRNAAS